MKTFTVRLKTGKVCKRCIRYENEDSEYVTNVYVKNNAFGSSDPPTEITITVSGYTVAIKKGKK